MIFENHLRIISRTASERLGFLRKSWQVFNIRLLVKRRFLVLSCPFWTNVLQCGARLLINTLLDRDVSGASFITEVVP